MFFMYHCWTLTGHFSIVLLYLYIYSHHNMDWIANTNTALYPNSSVVFSIYQTVCFRFLFNCLQIPDKISIIVNLTINTSFFRNYSVTAQLICFFVFAFAKSLSSHYVAYKLVICNQSPHPTPGE